MYHRVYGSMCRRMDGNDEHLPEPNIIIPLGVTYSSEMIFVVLAKSRYYKERNVQSKKRQAIRR